jgi:hypothetical protein
MILINNKEVIRTYQSHGHSGGNYLVNNPERTMTLKEVETPRFQSSKVSTSYEIFLMLGISTK